MPFGLGHVWHADVINPIAEDYASIYRVRYGFPLRAEVLERLVGFDLQLPYGWQDIAELEGVGILAQHDHRSGAIHANNHYADFLKEPPHLLTSALSHELGHVALRHVELYADAAMPTLPGMPMPSLFLHRAGALPWGVDEGLLRRAVKMAMMDDRVRAFLKPERFEPDWVYSQAQRFAAAFMIPHVRLREHLDESWDFTR